MSKKCIACGVELDDNAAFCEACGKKQTEEKEEQKKRCIACGNELDDNAAFCKVCGKKQTEEKEEQKKKCIACGNELDDNAAFCKACGKKQTEEKGQKKQTIEKGQDGQEEKRKKKIIICSLAAVVIGIVFLRMLLAEGLLWSAFIAAFFGLGGMGIYLMVLQEKHKRSKGIPIGDNIAAEDIANLLRENMECPFMNEITMNKKGNIEFSCKYGRHTAKIENRELHVDRMARKFGDYRDTEEAWYLQKYIAKVLAPETEEEDAETLDDNFAKYVKKLKIVRILQCLIIMLFVLVALKELRVVEYMKSDGVSHMYFSEYSSNISIGEALSYACVHGKWDKMKSGKREYISYNGENADGEALYILFEKNGDSCQIVSIEIDGVDYSFFQGTFLDALYSNVLDR